MKVMYVARLFSGLEASLLKRRWEPAGVPTVYKLIRELARLILDIMGKRDVEILSEEQRIRPENSEVYELICNNQKAKEICGWEPKHTMKEGLGKTIEWVEAHIEKLKPHIYNV